MSIPCADAGDRAAPAWRAAEPGDSDRIAALLDATHAGRELYPRGRTIVERLASAAPDRSLHDLRCSERAVIGIWDDGWSVTITRDDAFEQRRLATLAGWGAEPGAEDEFVALVRNACADLAARGITHLLVFTDERTPAYAALSHLACDGTGYYLSFPVPEPPGTAEHGLEVDPIYF